MITGRVCKTTQGHNSVAAGKQTQLGQGQVLGIS